MGMFDLSYPVAGWTLVALVVLPFLFGLLYGIHIATKKYIVKLVKSVSSEQLKSIVDNLEEDEKEDAHGRFNTAPTGCGDTIPGHQTNRN